MKNLRKALRRGLLSCVLVLSLLFGISASPAFAAYGEGSSADDSIAVQKSAGAPESGDPENPDDSSTGDADGDESAGDDGEGAGEGDEGTNDGEGDDGEDADEVEKPFNPIDAITKLPEVIGDEIDSLVDNATNNENIHNPVRKSYDKIWYSGQKIWKDAEGNDTNAPLDKDGNPIEQVTIRIQGFVDWDDNGEIGAADKEKTRSEYTAAGVLGTPKYAHDDYGYINSDLNHDGTVDAKDRYFDNELSGVPDMGYDNAIVPPYQVYDKKVEADSSGDWKYSTDNMEAYFYEYKPVVDEDGTELGTLTFVLDEENEPVRHKIVYSVTELPVDGYVSTRNPGGGEFDANDHPTKGDYSSFDDGGTENKVVDFVNTPKTVVDKTGKIVITKTFAGPIYASGSNGSYNTGNTTTAIFHIVGEMRGDDEAAGSGEKVFDGYRSLNFSGDGDRTQELVVSGLPVGAWYTVSEVVYDGCGYVPTGVAPAPFKLVAQPAAGDGNDAGDDANTDADAGQPEGDGDDAATEGTAPEGDEGEGTGDDGDDSADAPEAPKASFTVSFTNESTREETPNQGWINRYAPNGDGSYTITQIRETVQLR